MFSRAPENRMRIVRGVLALGWLMIIVSLFWDPITLTFTQPDNLASPFHVRNNPAIIQGQAIAQVPYHMSNRIFWTMFIPILPLFLMIAGHEAWRRICPLSFLSQIPRYLGLQRKKSIFIRRTGQVERQLALVNREGWLRKNTWYVQFGLLFVALNARILILNSDRTALGVFLLLVIITAMTVGFFWGGKTWCNYFCPVGIVQKIYTEPRGLLESRPHLTRQTITQSMCRTSTPEGERSICVGCTSHCPDIDLERSYWEHIQDPMIRNVYYSFFGLVLGFYVFYFLYSGNWDYYFSGAWTHEENLAGKMFDSGLFLFNTSIPIPKIIAAPIVLACFVGLGLGLGKILEAMYRAVLKVRHSALTEAEIVNRCLSFSAFITINTFYVFGGRSNINLFSPIAVRIIDFVVVAVTVLWFLRAIDRNPIRYRRESLATSLMEQLRKLKIDISRYVETPNIERLTPDEIYVLAKTLPSFSAEQRLLAYRNILVDAMKTGRTDSAESIERLRELRIEIGVSDEEHRQLLEEFGIDNAASALNAQKFASYEQWLRTDNYQRVIEPMIVGEMEKGIPIAQIFADHEIAKHITNARELYQISAEEHAEVIASICGQSGMIFERAKRQLERLRDNTISRFSFSHQTHNNAQSEAIYRILDAILLRRALLIAQRLCSVLRTLGDTKESHWLASSTSALLGEHIEKILNEPISSESKLSFSETLHPTILQLLRGATLESEAEKTSLPTIGFHQVVTDKVDIRHQLIQLVKDEDQLVCAVALTGLSFLDLNAAREQANHLQHHLPAAKNWLLEEVIATTLGTKFERQTNSTHHGLSLNLMQDNGESEPTLYQKDYLTIGRAADNDMVIHHPSVSPYHLSVFKEQNQVWVKPLDRFAPTFINGQAWEGERTPIQNGCSLSFLPPEALGPILFVEWLAHDANYTLEKSDNISKLLWLSSVSIFQSLDLATIAQLAVAAEVRLYPQGANLCHAGEPSSDAYLIQSGTAEVLFKDESTPQQVTSLEANAIVGELGVITGRPRVASVRITSPNARIVTINGDCLHKLMRQDPLVSMKMLHIVANYIRH